MGVDRVESCPRGLEETREDQSRSFCFQEIRRNTDVSGPNLQGSPDKYVNSTLRDTIVRFTPVLQLGQELLCVRGTASHSIGI